MLLDDDFEGKRWRNRELEYSGLEGGKHVYIWGLENYIVYGLATSIRKLRRCGVMGPVNTRISSRHNDMEICRSFSIHCFLSLSA
jgi:hypothetical protein